MFKTGLIAGFAAGYVLGSKAGRERYQQIVDSLRSFSQNPGVQRVSEEVNRTVNVGRERATTAANQAVEQASSTIAERTTKARERAAGKGGKDDDTTSATGPVSTTTTDTGSSTP